MEEKLNNLLADFTVETHKIQNFHWYIKGENFFNDHLKLEDYYNCDVDVEWACEKDTLYLIQCRPITT